MCKDNTTDLSTKCMAMIDCIEKSYPCTGNCQTNCLNMSGGSGVLSTCVTAPGHRCLPLKRPRSCAAADGDQYR